MKALKRSNAREWLASSGRENTPAPINELLKQDFILGKMNKTMTCIRNGAFLLNAISHSER
jgi:hypothetical protein